DDASRTALSASRQSGDLSIHGRRTEPAGYVHRQTDAPRVQRATPAGELPGGKAICVSQRRRDAAGEPAEVRPVRRVWSGVERSGPAPSKNRRRSLLVTWDQHRRVQPWTGQTVCEQRVASARPAQYGIVGYVWIGERSGRSAGVRRAPV